MSSHKNAPKMKIGVVGVSRDCFPIELTKRRLNDVTNACVKKGVHVTKISTIIESEKDAMAALRECAEKGVNACVIYLGNFGPEGPTSIFGSRFDGPVMLAAAAEETGKNLINGRGDALCGMLNASYNFGLRKRSVYIPQMPVGLPDEVAKKIGLFEKVATVVAGLKKLKVFAFGPRPQDFLACNAPIKPLYDLGIEVMENSELDMFCLYNDAAGEKAKIAKTAKEMQQELGKGAAYPDLLPKLAQFEVALKKFMSENIGAAEYGVFANKCWPSFEKSFGFVPCYVNSRLASQGIPAACEVDIYGAISEYCCYLATGKTPTLLDVNNSVPEDMCKGKKLGKGVTQKDLFMGFHCGNTACECLDGCAMKFQLIMNRLMEDPQKSPDITRGTLEGKLKSGPTTIFRLQGTADCRLRSYVAEGEILEMDPQTFGGTGVFAIPDFARFYRHVMIEKRFPHHSAVAFDKVGRVLYDAMKMMNVCEIDAPRPAGVLYPGENPFGA